MTDVSKLGETAYERVTWTITATLGWTFQAGTHSVGIRPTRR